MAGRTGAPLPVWVNRSCRQAEQTCVVEASSLQVPWSTVRTTATRTTSIMAAAAAAAAAAATHLALREALLVLLRRGPRLRQLPLHLADLGLQLRGSREPRVRVKPTCQTDGPVQHGFRKDAVEANTFGPMPFRVSPPDHRPVAYPQVTNCSAPALTPALPRPSAPNLPILYRPIRLPLPALLHNTLWHQGAAQVSRSHCVHTLTRALPSLPHRPVTERHPAVLP